MHGTTARREHPLIGAIVPLPDMEVATPDVPRREGAGGRSSCPGLTPFAGGWLALLRPRFLPLGGSRERPVAFRRRWDPTSSIAAALCGFSRRL